MQKELDSEKPEGEQALNDLFKSIYGKVGVWLRIRYSLEHLFRWFVAAAAAACGCGCCCCCCFWCCPPHSWTLGVSGTLVGMYGRQFNPTNFS